MFKYKVNENGLEQISKLLKRWHKDGEILSTVRDSLIAFAHVIEHNMSTDNCPTFSIPHHSSVSGFTELCTITIDGIDCERVFLDHD